MVTQGCRDLNLGRHSDRPLWRPRSDKFGCDNKLARYRSLLDEDGDVAIAAQWITETQKERRAPEAQLGQRIPGGTMNPEEVKALVTALHDDRRRGREAPHSREPVDDVRLKYLDRSGGVALRDPA